MSSWAHEKDWPTSVQRSSTLMRSGMSRNCSGARGGPVPRNDRGSRTRLSLRLGEPSPEWSDSRLVRECLRGNDRAWSALIAKYKTLIYSIPLRYGATPEDAADIFQSVCLELFAELPRLRRSAALRSWLITVTAHMSFQWKMKRRRRAEQELGDLDEDNLEA